MEEQKLEDKILIKKNSDDKGHPAKTPKGNVDTDANVLCDGYNFNGDLHSNENIDLNKKIEGPKEKNNECQSVSPNTDVETEEDSKKKNINSRVRMEEGNNKIDADDGKQDNLYSKNNVSAKNGESKRQFLLEDIKENLKIDSEEKAKELSQYIQSLLDIYASAAKDGNKSISNIFKSSNNERGSDPRSNGNSNNDEVSNNNTNSRGTYTSSSNTDDDNSYNTDSHTTSGKPTEGDEQPRERQRTNDDDYEKAGRALGDRKKVKEKNEKLDGYEKRMVEKLNNIKILGVGTADRLSAFKKKFNENLGILRESNLEGYENIEEINYAVREICSYIENFVSYLPILLVFFFCFLFVMLPLLCFGFFALIAALPLLSLLPALIVLFLPLFLPTLATTFSHFFFPDGEYNNDDMNDDDGIAHSAEYGNTEYKKYNNSIVKGEYGNNEDNTRNFGSNINMLCDNNTNTSSTNSDIDDNKNVSIISHRPTNQCDNTTMQKNKCSVNASKTKALCTEDINKNMKKNKRNIRNMLGIIAALCLILLPFCLFFCIPFLFFSSFLLFIFFPFFGFFLPCIIIIALPFIIFVNLTVGVFFLFYFSPISTWLRGKFNRMFRKVAKML